MSFYWPWMLLTFLLVPLLIAIYIWNLRRKRKYAVRYSSIALIRDALPRHSRWRQHLPFVFFVLAIAALSLAVARPTRAMKIPQSRTTIILALDVSRSMCAIDVPPNRLTVAQEAALAFIDEQADDTRIGLVAFAGFAEVVVPPTHDKDQLTDAVENFTTSLGTAIGSATLKSIDAIAEVNEAVPPSGVNLADSDSGEPSDISFYQPDIIVVLTDGANSQGPLPLDAAEYAADRQLRIYTIGFGSDDPQQMVCSPEQLGSDAFGGRFGGGGPGGPRLGGGGFGGFRRFLVIDEDTLQGMAEMTGGEYYRAENAEQLTDVFATLPQEVVLQREQVEMTVFLALLAAAFTLISLSLSLLWHRFP